VTTTLTTPHADRAAWTGFLALASFEFLTVMDAAVVNISLLLDLCPPWIDQAKAK